MQEAGCSDNDQEQDMILTADGDGYVTPAD